MNDLQTPPCKILFVDDEQLILNALRRSLRREGFELYFTSDPFEAGKLIGEHKIDIIVSDHMMPQMTGVEVLALVRRLHNQTFRIMMTGQADRDATIRAINEGNIHRFIEKPWDDATLKSILHEAARSIAVHRRVEAEMAAQQQQMIAAAAAAAAGKATQPKMKSIQRDSTGAIVLDVGMND